MSSSRVPSGPSRSSRTRHEHPMSKPSYVMTSEQIAPHQVKVRSVTFVKEMQAITGDRFRAYRAPDGEVCEVRVSCGAYAPDEPRWTDAEAREHAITSLN